jgi:hypothetical protein
VLRCLSPAMSYAGTTPRFFAYTHPALDMSWLSTCRGYDELLLSAHARFMIEVGVAEVLRHHRRRALDPREAELFYVPVFECTRLCDERSSHLTGECDKLVHACARATLYVQTPASSSVGSI